MPDETNDEICPKTGGEHMPDYTKVNTSDCEHHVLNVPCVNCGRNGQFSIYPDDVQWEGAE